MNAEEMRKAYEEKLIARVDDSMHNGKSMTTGNLAWEAIKEMLAQAEVQRAALANIEAERHQWRELFLKAQSSLEGGIAMAHRINDSVRERDAQILAALAVVTSYSVDPGKRGHGMTNQFSRLVWYARGRNDMADDVRAVLASPVALASPAEKSGK